MAASDSENANEFLSAHRAKKALERAFAGKILRRFATNMAAHGFSRRSTFFSREREHLIQFIHVHKFSFGPSFRIHACLRVLNDDSPCPTLNGISSDSDAHYRMSIEYSDREDSIDSCVAEMTGYIENVALPWFELNNFDALLSDRSTLRADKRAALAAALRGESRPSNVELSRSLFGGSVTNRSTRSREKRAPN